MSVIVTATYEGETFEVEIFRDGSLDFLGHSLEYDRTVFALGGELSVFVKFDDIWAMEPVKEICNNIELPKNYIILVSADFAEHVLYIFEGKRPEDPRPRQAVNIMRMFVAGDIDIATLKKFENAAWEAGAAVSAKEARTTMVKRAAMAWAAVARVAQSAAWAAAVATTREAMVRAARAAARAVAYSASSNQDSAEWQQAYDIEVAWQVRRFVDCMEAVGQGLPWPPLEATE